MPLPKRPIATGLALALAGCGSAAPKPAPTARFADFPKPGAVDLRALATSGPHDAVFASSVSVFRTGTNRVGFALFRADRKQISDAPVALYTADANGRNLTGPYPARAESLTVKSRFRSQTVAQDPDAAASVYVADVSFPRSGKAELVALARINGKLELVGGTPAAVGQPGGPPDVGQPAIRVHTPTVAQVGRANVATIDTRTPPAPDLQQVDFANVLGRKPVVLVFATPQLCQSRVCGPVTDIEEQVRSEVGDRVAFIHAEIYNHNIVSRGFRPQVLAWRLPTEPWAFVIDSHGRIAARFEGAFSVSELRAAVQRVS